MADLSDPAVLEFLMSGTRTAKVGFTARDGRPLVAPVWFVVDGDDIVFNTGVKSAKGNAIARDNRIVVCVDLEVAPFGFVQVQGVAEVSEEPTELLRLATAIAARYVGADRADEFGRRNSTPGEAVVRLRPTKVIANLDVTA
ncbi:PPOX class F420-dependent oxidoreductase [Antrihabitans sp. YC3-6]|uniref:PPOX class F420-dependent oxidoreductase n=1 Tax=Antrihabitans stalagmiti TaxID=2799499 RepID=A0A934NP42_9NOCA|nr:PPOX class F420-dependent oxidoreductase [Antrihabitans stalagmiti]MBJ8338742.1 PPOX class F420-dependent oxidoreductase [Antrihabitans stalagmiti]